MAANPVRRLRLLSVLVFALTAALVARLFFLQIIKGSYYTVRADRQYQLPAEQLPDRGTIFFRQKNDQLVSAATMRDGFLAAVNPTQVKAAEAIYQKLSPLLPLDHDSFIKKATKVNDPYEEIASRLDQKTADEIKAWHLPGLAVYQSRWRFYPAGRTAAQVLGLVNYDGVGTYGLEQYYESLLHRDPDQTFSGFLAGVLSDFGSSLWGREAGGSEADLVSSIEPTVESTLESELGTAKAQWQSETIGGIIMNPQTGEILAMAALPNFDPGGKQADLGVLGNPLVERVYEMGSIMKPLTMAAALDAGVVKASTTYNDQGLLILDGKIIGNYDGRGRGVVSMQEVLNQSLNTGAVFAMQKLGHEQFRDYLLKYGLAEKTGIDLPNEVTGLTNNLNSHRDIEYATAAYGQGIAISPITMARALAVLANGGKLVRPQVISAFNYRNSQLARVVKPEIIRQVLKPETSKEITRMLVSVVDHALLGGQYKMAKYTVAAKTGTAQQVRPGASDYDPDYFLHSFFGYFPASNPQFLIFLYQVHPLGAKYASETLTAPFMSLAKFLLNYYNVPPDR